MGGYIGNKSSVVLTGSYTKEQADAKFPDKTSLVAEDFAAMPTVGGDPIVESGSNADGGWTKWADGTTLMSVIISLPDNNNAGTLFNFPQTLISTGDDLSITAGGSGNASSGTASSFVIETAVVSVSSGRVKALIHTATSITNPNTAVRVTIKGRWK